MGKSAHALSSGQAAKAGTRVRSAQGRQALSSAAPLGLLALHLLTTWRNAGSDGLVFVAKDEARAERLGAILHALDPACDVLVLPRFDTLPFDEVEPSREIAGRRASVLRRLAARASPPLLIATVDAMLPRVPRPQAWSHAGLRLRIGQSIAVDELRRRLADAGYELDEPADYPGGVLCHGQTIELFPAGALGPVRIEHGDGVIRGIHGFDPVNQTDLVSLEALVLDPMSERNLVGETTNGVSVFSYLDKVKIIADAEVPARADAQLAVIEDSSDARSREAAFISRGEWQQAMRHAAALPALSEIAAIPNFSREPSAPTSLRRFIAEARRRGARLMFTACTDRDLQHMERLAGLKTSRAADWHGASRPPPGKVTSLLIDLDAGFRTATARPLLVITAADILGSRAHHLQPMARQHADLTEATTRPTLGSAVIHLQRGLAVLQGLEQVATADLSAREMVRLVFADDEAVLVPTAELALIWPYAHDPSGVALDDADGQSWAARCLKAEREVDRTAQILSEAILARKQAKAPRLVPPTAEYERFVARFPYYATPDQTAAIEDVLNDLASGHPMDRIVCGDVGFGKTEVALRAAAAAVFAGMQVALVVPTTVLARQHVETFQKRFAPFGITIGHLSRLTPATEARVVKQQLRDGSLKIVIGTHALAGKEIAFSDLGLVIIDEEQHFGAADKDKLSALRAGVHTLTMSATPIPRTMASAMAGLRDVSVIATPPVQRVPIITKVSPLLDSTLAMALRREHRRHGQSFVICPRIKDLGPMAERLHDTGPELRVVVIHGRMAARDIDARMMQFVGGEADVLLATDIVENGLDIPRANTILICAPERFGLAQLHQLRGRVGRGGTRAYAYLLTDEPGEDAEKRIAALLELSRPGAGFQIGARDLDLRGAGNLLSDQQSGRVHVFGPALYHDLLARALQARPRHARDMWVPELHIDTPALLPASYVQDEATRLDIYARLARVESPAELGDIEDEIEIRFGPVPPEVKNLIAMAALRLDCRALGITRIDVGPTGIAAQLRPDSRVARQAAPIRRSGDRLISKHVVKSSQMLQAVVLFIKALKKAQSNAPTHRTAARAPKASRHDAAIGSS
ncbi:TRCF domain-containing protein [Bradyrhizobium sp. HKCCYLS1011]|uniref:TRCF domain-containing protein n=1 Tax=Bradyrhizobium sp. HKCCYLS1011 TaxID=3420733 RepID=UPI003EC0A7F9